ncbi:MAG: tyrosine-type recombinase/integrase [Cyanobacteria bacterium P01_F01_bin.53]
MTEQLNAKWLTKFKMFLERKFPNRTTATHYISDIKQFLNSYDGSLLEVSPTDIDRFIDRQRASGKSSSTVKRRVSSLKSFFEYVRREQGDPIWENPVHLKRHASKQAKQLPKDLSNEEVKRLLDVIKSERDRAMVLLMLYGGLRVGELLSVKKVDFTVPKEEGEPVRLRVKGKGEKERIVYLPQPSFEPIERYLSGVGDDAPSLFTNHRGKPLLSNGVQWVLRRYGQECGVSLTPHQLRHTCARWLAEGRMPLLSLSRFLGHRDVHTTQRYIDNADVGVRDQYQSAMTQSQETQATQEPVWPDVGNEASAAVRRDPPDRFQAPPWFQDWPAPIRRGILDWLTQRWPEWKPSRRQSNAARHLYALRAFWQWQWDQPRPVPLQEWGALRLSDIEAFTSAELKRGLKAKTVKSTLDRVYAVLRFLVDRQQVETLLPRPDMLLPDSLPKHLQPQELLTIETFVAQQLPTANPTTLLNIALYYILAHSGLRISECLDLRMRDVDLSFGRLRIVAGKDNKDRIVYLTSTATDALKQYVVTVPHTPNDLFFSIDERPLTYSTAYKRLRAFGLSAGVPDLSPLCLRHTFATTLLNNGISITALRKLMGHENLNTTLIYARLADTTVRHQYLQAMQNVTKNVSN